MKNVITGLPSTIFNLFKDSLDGLGWLLNTIYDVIKDIPQKIDDLFNLLTTLLSYINPLSDNFFLKIAFVPSPGFLTNYASEQLSNIFESFWIVQIFQDVMDQVKEISLTSPKPEFTIDLPAKWGGTTVKFIDLQFYDDYRDYIHTFIKVVAWFFFLKSLVRRAPNMIYK
ncbi:hypothetical protein [Fusibacter bizertensis]